MAQWIKNLPAMQETQEMLVPSLDWEDPFEEGMATPLQYSCLENPIDRSLAGCSPEGRKESDRTEETQHTHTAFYLWAPWKRNPVSFIFLFPLAECQAESTNHLYNKWREILLEINCKARSWKYVTPSGIQMVVLNAQAAQMCASLGLCSVFVWPLTPHMLFDTCVQWKYAHSFHVFCQFLIY